MVSDDEVVVPRGSAAPPDGLVVTPDELDAVCEAEAGALVAASPSGSVAVYPSVHGRPKAA